MVLPQGDDVYADSVSQNRLLHDPADRVGVRQQVARVVHGDVAEGVESELDS
ncbi:hypothetical protein [Modestobacter lapidis]